jgi:hypothetical protein
MLKEEGIEDLVVGFGTIEHMVEVLKALLRKDEFIAAGI